MMTGQAAALSPRELDAIVDYVLSIALHAARNSGPSRDVVARLSAAGFKPIPGEKPAPAFAAKGVGGETVRLDALRGKLVLVVFWGTSCGPCLEELPELETLANRFKQNGLEIVPICLDEPDITVARRPRSGSSHLC